MSYTGKCNRVPSLLNAGVSGRRLEKARTLMRSSGLTWYRDSPAICSSLYSSCRVQLRALGTETMGMDDDAVGG